MGMILSQIYNEIKDMGIIDSPPLNEQEVETVNKIAEICRNDPEFQEYSKRMFKAIITGEIYD